MCAGIFVYKYTFSGDNSSKTIQKFGDCNINCMICFEGCFKDNPNPQYINSSLTSHIYLELKHGKPRKIKILFLGRNCTLT